MRDVLFSQGSVVNSWLHNTGTYLQTNWCLCVCVRYKFFARSPQIPIFTITIHRNPSLSSHFHAGAEVPPPPPHLPSGRLVTMVARGQTAGENAIKMRSLGSEGVEVLSTQQHDLGWRMEDLLEYPGFWRME